LSDDADQANTTELSVVATCRTPAGAEGATVSGHAAVDTVVEVTSEWSSPPSNTSTPTV
jgi:hypothetical protein